MSDLPVDPAVTPDTIKITSPVNPAAIQISIPTQGPAGSTDFVVVSIPIAGATGEVDVTRISGTTGATIDTIKITL